MSLQSQAVPGMIMVIPIIYKEQSEIPRQAHSVVGGGGKKIR